MAKKKKKVKNTLQTMLHVPIRCMSCGQVYFTLHRKMELPQPLYIVPSEILWASPDVLVRLAAHLEFNNCVMRVVLVPFASDGSGVGFHLGGGMVPHDVSEETLALIASVARDNGFKVAMAAESLFEAWKQHATPNNTNNSCTEEPAYDGEDDDDFSNNDGEDGDGNDDDNWV